MSEPESHLSIEHEPQRRAAKFESDPSEASARENLAKQAVDAPTSNLVENSVWDEPSRSPTLAGHPGADDLTYARWLSERVANVSIIRSWLVTLTIAVLAGPWGLVGALFIGGESLIGLVTVAVVAPVTEEITKVAAALWIVEKRPYLYRRPVQIVLCGLASGLTFAAIENMMYLYYYFPDHTARLTMWRWTACCLMHTSASTITSLGLIRIWSHTMKHKSRPDLSRGAPLFVSAMIVHGVYNVAVEVSERLGWLHF